MKNTTNPEDTTFHLSMILYNICSAYFKVCPKLNIKYRKLNIKNKSNIKEFRAMFLAPLIIPYSPITSVLIPPRFLQNC